MVGLKRTSNGILCEMHDYFAEYIYPHHLVCFKCSVVNVDGKTKEAVIVICCVWGDTESYTIGFLPRNVVKSRKNRLVGQFTEIIELYEYSDSLFCYIYKLKAFFCLCCLS